MVIHKRSFPSPLEKEQIAWQFSRAAASYDSVAQLQRQMSDRLVEQIDSEQTGVLVDFGCGTGSSLIELASSRKLRLMGFDLAQGMIQVAREKLQALKLETSIELWVADLLASQLPDQAVDIVFSNASIQWSDLAAALGEMHRVLKPAGRILVSTFGPETLAEVRQAWQEIGDNAPRVHEFVGLSVIERELGNAGFEDLDLVAETVVLNYPSARELLYSLKRLGATNAHTDRRQGLLGVSQFRRLCESLEKYSVAGRLSVRYQPVYFSGRKR